MQLRFSRAQLCLAMSLSIATCVASGAAEPLSQVTVTWQAPAECPDSIALHNELVRDLEGSQVPGERLDAQATVDQTDANTWRVHIALTTSDGKSDRWLFAHSCQALADATSLIVAMHIDPETAATHARALESVSEPSPAAPGVVNAPAAPIVSYPGQAPPASMQRNLVPDGTKTIETNPAGSPSAAAAQTASVLWPHRSAFVGAWVLRDWGSMPTADWAFGGDVGASLGRWQIDTAIGVWLNKQKDAPQSGLIPPRITLGMLSGAVRACYGVWSHGPLQLSPCAGVEVERRTGEGTAHLVSTNKRAVPDVSPNLRALANLNIYGPLSLPLHFDVLFPLNPPRFGFTDAAGTTEYSVWQPSRVAFRVGTGVQLHFR